MTFFFGFKGKFETLGALASSKSETSYYPLCAISRDKCFVYG